MSNGLLLFCSPLGFERAVWGGLTKSSHKIEVVLNEKFIHSKYRKEISEKNSTPYNWLFTSVDV